MTIKVRDRQSIWDIALQVCGDAEAAFAIAELNDVSLSEQLAVGTTLKVPSVMEKRVVEYYAQNKIVPASIEADTNYLITYMEENIITNENENMIENG